MTASTGKPKVSPPKGVPDPWQAFRPVARAFSQVARAFTSTSRIVSRKLAPLARPFKSIAGMLPTNVWLGIAAFLVPTITMICVYAYMGVWLGSPRTLLASDAFSQFTNFYASYRNMLLGRQSDMFSWGAGPGLSYIPLISYYLGGLFTPLVIFFNNSLMPDALYVLTLLKFGMCGLAFFVYARRTFRIQPYMWLVLSSCYALNGFALAQSELIMYFDAYIYLPLVILGIDRLFRAKQGKLLFFAYMVLFISNFYMGYMIGIFSALYYLVRLMVHPKRYAFTIYRYLRASVCAIGASLVIVLPTILDIREHGETMTPMVWKQTAATNIWDLAVKSMIGVFDTTKYGSTPFIYAGFLPLIFCMYFFVSRGFGGLRIVRASKLRLRITRSAGVSIERMRADADNRVSGSWRERVGFALILAILIASFYIEPLNLFWQGFKTPYMFLFRYAFLFVFMVIMLAGYGWQFYSHKDLWRLLCIGVALIAVFAYIRKFVAVDIMGIYNYLTNQSVYLSCFFVAAIMVIAMGFYLFGNHPKLLAFLLCILVVGELGYNTRETIQQVASDWSFPPRSIYAQPYRPIEKLVGVANALEKDEAFFRMENKSAMSVNESMNFGYNGVSLFSSIRNQDSSKTLDRLGFRSEGTNLNVRYDDNTMLGDALFGIKYLISGENAPQRFGYEQVTTVSDGASGNAASNNMVSSDDLPQSVDISSSTSSSTSSSSSGKGKVGASAGSSTGSSKSDATNSSTDDSSGDSSNNADTSQTTTAQTPKNYVLNRNENVAPLGVLAPRKLADLKLGSDILENQTKLMSALADGSVSNADDVSGRYFSQVEPKLLPSPNLEVRNQSKGRQLFQFVFDLEARHDLDKSSVNYQVKVPAGRQAYLYLQTVGSNRLNGQIYKTISIDGKAVSTTQLSLSGFYYDLGFYEKETTIDFSFAFSNADNLLVNTPKVVFLDADAVLADTQSIQDNGVDFMVDGNRASAELVADENQMVWMSIPYDKGWQLKIDGKSSPVESFDDGLLAFDVPKGRHSVELSFEARGFDVGFTTFVMSCAGFMLLARKRSLDESFGAIGERRNTNVA
ncbi:MAG: YfhO family protein [Bifidobacterium sp.]|uniref:YfhO family protein n=1 Tax=Bifidobacterium sp. TaxID=41200 RepID=UPI0039E8873C